MADPCDDCLEIKRLGFRIGDVDIALRKQQVDLDGIKLQQEARDTEHEAMIQNLSTRMDSMEQKFDSLRDEVKADVASIKEDIPNLFENAINRLMARVLKYIIIGFASLLGFIVLVVVLAFSRPYIIDGLKELTQKVERMEVDK